MCLAGNGVGSNEPYLVVRIHIGIDEETLEVRAVHCPAGASVRCCREGRNPPAATSGDGSHGYPSCLDQILPNPDIGQSVTRPSSADCFAIACRAIWTGVVRTRKCQRGDCQPRCHAVIQPRKKCASLGSPLSVAGRSSNCLGSGRSGQAAICPVNDAGQCATVILGRTVVASLERIPTAKAALRTKWQVVNEITLANRFMGEGLRRQVAEIQIRNCCLNRYTAIGYLSQRQ